MGDAKMWTNIGSMRAKGYEVSLNIKDYSKAFTYDINFNFSKIKNTAIKLIGNEPQYNGSFLNQTTHKTEVGGEIGRFSCMRLTDCSRIRKKSILIQMNMGI